MGYVQPLSTLTASWQGASAASPPLGRIYTSWGASAYVAPLGIFGESGQPSLWQQIIVTPHGWPSPWFGDAQVTNEGFYPHPVWGIDASWLGESPYCPTSTLVSFSTSPVLLAYGFDASRFGEQLVTKQQFVSETGVGDTLRMGSGFALHWYEYARPEWSLDVSWLGSDEYAPPASHLDGKWSLPAEATQIGLIGFNASLYGTPFVGLSQRFVYYSGFSSTQFGQPTAFNKTRYILAGGKPSSLTFGQSIVFNRTRYLANVTVGQTQAFGNAMLAGGLRQLLASGIAPPSVGFAWASHSPRYLTPAGIPWNFHTNHLVGYARSVSPLGFDAARFGTRIIPESTEIYPQGWASESVGESWVSNRRRPIAPHGFSANASEEMRHGSQFVWNSRQYLTLNYDPNRDFPGAEFGIWTKIENRNRVISHHSTTPSALPSPSVDNRARPLRPLGIVAPDPAPFERIGLVAYRIRHLPLYGIEPIPPSRWLVVRNDARIVRPSGFLSDLHGTHSAINTRRIIDRIGGFGSQEFGSQFVAYAIRSISFDSRYGISPPQINLPNVRLDTRYVEPSGIDSYRSGAQHLHIHWSIIYPRFDHRDDRLFGIAAVRNKTPVLHQRGANHEEFGNTQIRTQWRRIETRETFTQIFGNHKVADRRLWIRPLAIGPVPIGDKLTVIRLGAEPPSTRTIQPAGIFVPGGESGGDYRQFGQETFLNWRSIFPESEHPMTEFGLASVREMAIDLRGSPSIFLVDAVPAPTVYLRRRFITEPKHIERGETPEEEARNWFGFPQCSPWTVYSVIGGTEQAKYNHNERRGIVEELHLVDQDPQTGLMKKGVGTPVVTMLNRRVFHNSTFSDRPYTHPTPFTFYGSPSVDLRVRVIAPESLPLPRSGFHRILGVRRTILHDSRDNTSAAVGSPFVSNGTRTMQAQGRKMDNYGLPVVDYFNRFVRPVGWSSQRMGEGSPADSPWQWQRLRVGPVVPTVPTGFSAEQFGVTFISPRVRGISAQGFDAFVSDFDYLHFNQRMRVKNAAVIDTSRALLHTGEDSHAPGWAFVRNAAVRIRPDGNMDNFRKGAPNA